MIKLKLFNIIFLPILIFLQACGGDSGQSTVQALDAPTPGYAIFWGSCDNTKPAEKNFDKFSESSDDVERNCREWYGGFFANINLQQACGSVSEGVLSQDHCSELDLLGICSVPISIDSETRYFYYPSDWILESAKKNCESKDVNAQWLDLSKFE